MCCRAVVRLVRLRPSTKAELAEHHLPFWLKGTGSTEVLKQEPYSEQDGKGGQRGGRSTQRAQSGFTLDFRLSKRKAELPWWLRL